MVYTDYRALLCATGCCAAMQKLLVSAASKAADKAHAAISRVGAGLTKLSKSKKLFFFAFETNKRFVFLVSCQICIPGLTAGQLRYCRTRWQD